MRTVWIAISAALVADQITKALALALLDAGQPVAVLPGVALTLGFNTGASFGLLAGAMAGRPLLMAAATLLLAAGFLFLALRSRHRGEAAGYGLIAGGALGNIIDRLRQGAVTDFLDLSWRGWHWPTFNLADVAITCGVVLVLATPLFTARPERTHAR